MGDDSNGNTVDVRSADHSGGTTADQINVQPEWRQLRDRLSDISAINRIVDSHKGATIAFRVPIGDAEAMNYAEQIRDLLTNNLLPVDQIIGEGLGGGEPLPPLSYTPEGKKIVIQVGNQYSQAELTDQ